MKVTETFNGRRQFPVTGVYFELLSTVNPVDLEFYDAQGVLIESIAAVEEGFFVNRKGARGFVRVEIVTGASEAVSFLYTDGLSGNRSVPADVTDRAARLLGIASWNAATALANAAQVSVGVAEVAVLAAAATRKAVRFYSVATNTGTIYLGATGVTTANGCVALAPGDFYSEETAAGCAWFAISDVAAQGLRVQSAT